MARVPMVHHPCHTSIPINSCIDRRESPSQHSQSILTGFCLEVYFPRALPEIFSCSNDLHLEKFFETPLLSIDPQYTVSATDKQEKLFYCGTRTAKCFIGHRLSTVEWNQVFCSDEFEFNLSSDDNRVRVWRLRGKCLNPAFALQRHTASTVAVMVWSPIAL
ncbi:hypothetical protein TNCV_1886641 [Trichonephila clavipes]|nr:hypothetical protein TNCV_1886641 [Trichonephila clavipes]